MLKVNIPLNVPPEHKAKYYKNFRLATKKTGRLMLLAGDQKIEHLNDDFYGNGIHADDAKPEHLFQIAKQAKVGVLAVHLGLLTSYAKDYRTIPYLVKLNGKTNLVETNDQDPQSLALHTVDQVVELQKETRLKIVGVGYTIYLGSRYENSMLTEAAQVIYQAHRQGLLAVLWIYPRGQAVDNEKDSHLIAGAVGIAACLGADFVKVQYPAKADRKKIDEIIKAAGATGVIFSGGSSIAPKLFLKRLEQQISYGARGTATGRNIHQQGLKQAVNMSKAITAVSLYDYTSADGYQIYSGKKKFNK